MRTWPVRRRYGCAARAAACACAVAAAVGQPVQARDWRSAITPGNPGISVLAPAQAFPVRPARAIPGYELPAASPDGVATAGGPVMDREDRALPAPEPVRPAYDWSYDYAGYGPRPGGSVMLVSPVGAPPARLGAVPARTGLDRGTQYWSYHEAGGPTWSFGGVTTKGPAWAEASRLGGLQVSSWQGADALLAEGQFGYSSTIGRLDYSDVQAGDGSLVFGDSAGSGTLRYGLTPALTVESQIQAAPSMAAMGLGGRYAMGAWGTLQAAAVQSRYEQMQGWRYELGYSVDLGAGTTLGLSNELIGPYYSDLSLYDSGYQGVTQMRNTVTAGLPLGAGLGTLAGTYSGVRAGSVSTEQRFGLQHTMALAPRVSLSLGADRDVVTGDYAMQMQLSMPVDMFIGGLGWRP